MYYPKTYESVPGKFVRHRTGFKKIGFNLYRSTFQPITEVDLKRLLESKQSIQGAMKSRKVVSTNDRFAKLLTREVFIRVTDPDVLAAYEAGEKALKAEIARWQTASVGRKIQTLTMRIRQAEREIAHNKTRVDKLRLSLDPNACSAARSLLKQVEQATSVL